MTNNSYARTAAGMFDTLNRRLTSVERRLPPAPPPPTGGTTAARNVLFGVPATDAERVALANQIPTWNNTSTGWLEGYYAETGLAGLTVFGLTPGAASGWYPIGRADYAFAAKRNGYQSISSGSSALIDGMTMIRDRGSINLTSNRLVLPRAGEYDVRIKFYLTGGYTSVTIGCSLTGTVPDGNNAGGLPSMVCVTPANNADMTYVATRTGILATGATVGLVANVNIIYGGVAQVWGDASNAGQGTSLEIAYVGPPLADG